MVDAAHHDQLKQHGGLHGIRDENALESALARPRHRWEYEPDSDIFDLAAAYGFGLAANHGYSDGNKRIAFMAVYMFLGINDWDIVATDVEIVQLMLDLASSNRDETALAAWLREHGEPFVT